MMTFICAAVYVWGIPRQNVIIFTPQIIHNQYYIIKRKWLTKMCLLVNLLTTVVPWLCWRLHDEVFSPTWEVSSWYEECLGIFQSKNNVLPIWLFRSLLRIIWPTDSDCCFYFSKLVHWLFFSRLFTDWSILLAINKNSKLSYLLYPLWDATFQLGQRLRLTTAGVGV